MPSSSLTTSTPPRPAPKWCAIAATLLLILIAWPFILTQNSSGRGAADDLNYHWPTIQTFANQLPTPDLSDYASATTPGYHLELAVVHRLGFPRTLVQLYTSLWSVLLIGTLAWYAGKSFGKPGLLLITPLLASIYVLFPAIWLLPDNAGWFIILIILILTLDHPPSTRTLLTAGITLAFLVLVRQVHIWAAAIIWTAAWIGSNTQTPTLTNIFSKPTPRIKRLAIALLATLPAALLLLYFVRLWGGLVPPTFQSQHQGPNPATPSFILTQIAILSVFFTPLLLPQLKRILRTHTYWLAAALFLAIALAIIPETTYNRDQGRYSGWWLLANHLPTFANRSLFILLAAPLGALCCVIWCSMISRRDAWIFSITLIAFSAAQSTNHASWQRYHEPLLLILGLLILTRAPIAINAPKRVFLGALSLSTLLAAITVSIMLNAKPITPNNQQDQSITPQTTPQTAPQTAP